MVPKNSLIGTFDFADPAVRHVQGRISAALVETPNEQTVGCGGVTIAVCTRRKQPEVGIEAPHPQSRLSSMLSI